MTTLDYLIALPFIAGILLFFIPVRLSILKTILAIGVSGVVVYFSIVLYFTGASDTESGILALFGFNPEFVDFANRYFLFRVDSLSKLIVFFISFFGVGMCIYSAAYINQKSGFKNYYSYVLLTIGASIGAAFADNLLLFLMFWGFLGITLFKLIKSYDKESAHAASKSLILVGGSDALMMFGIVIIWHMKGELNMSNLCISTQSVPEILAFVALLIGSFTKAGAFPFHTWIPDYAHKATASSSAFLPASLDKLLGIYFLTRLCHEIFALNQWLTFIIILLGVVTIIIAVMMALIQSNPKKLLGYHAVSQVGYMVTGLGLGSFLGIVGGLFHMINNALYKSGLFFIVGNVEKQTGKDNLKDLGGLSKVMPVTFFAALVFALSISGIPPLNGFASKWIIYQAIIEFGRESGLANSFWIVWLALAVIGSALTLASFIKFISGIFFGRKKAEFAKVKEVNILMLVPVALIAVLCIGFGVLAAGYVVPFLFNNIIGPVDYIGAWSSGLISLLVLASVILGVLIYILGNLNNMRREDSFIGGELIQETTGHSVTEFYNTISNFKLFRYLYDKAKNRWFDIYYLSRNGGLWCYKMLGKAHNGILLNYAIWLVIGLILMLIFLA